MKIAKLFAMCLIGTFAFGFTACSSDDDNTEETKHYGEELKSVVSNYVDVVVEPTYRNWPVRLMCFTQLVRT